MWRDCSSKGVEPLYLSGRPLLPDDHWSWGRMSRCTAEGKRQSEAHGEMLCALPSVKMTLRLLLEASGRMGTMVVDTMEAALCGRGLRRKGWRTSVEEPGPLKQTR